jgi:hypothetical protein
MANFYGYHRPYCNESRPRETKYANLGCTCGYDEALKKIIEER